MTEFLTLIAMLLLLLLKGFFSGSELAMVSIDRVRLRLRAAGGSSGSKLAMRLLDDPTKLLTTTLLGGNMSSVALTTTGTMLMIGLFGGSGELIALIVFTPLFLILGEIVPKSVYQQKAVELAPVVAYPLSWMQALLAPLVWLFSQVAKLAASLVGGASGAESAREQFIATVQMAEKTGAAAAFERGQVRRVLRYAQMSAAEAMWPLTEARILPADASMAEIAALRRETGQILIPLCGDGAGDVARVIRLESWDLFDPDLDRRDPAEFEAEMIVAPTVQRVSLLIDQLQAAPRAVALVVDEFGAAAGMITLKLLMRDTLGAQTSPLTDREAGPRPQRPEGADRWEVDAVCPVARVNDVLDSEFSTMTHPSIGGVALEAFGRLPKAGESVELEGWRIDVLEADARAIRRLGLCRSSE